MHGACLRHIRQHELSGMRFGGRYEVRNSCRFGALGEPQRLLDLLLLVDLLAEVLVLDELARIRRHWLDVTGDDFVEVLELLLPDPQRLTEAEAVGLLLLEHVYVRAHTARHLPRHRQMIGSLAAGTYYDVTVVHIHHSFLGGLVVDVVEVYVVDNALDVSGSVGVLILLVILVLILQLFLVVEMIVVAHHIGAVFVAQVRAAARKIDLEAFDVELDLNLVPKSLRSLFLF